MPPEDVSHRDIYVRLAELGAKIDSILQLMAERKEEVARITKDLDALFSRQRTLENRMAQVVIVGALAAILIPVLGQALELKLSIPTGIERQGAKP
jgi:hypothetical protein